MSIKGRFWATNCNCNQSLPTQIALQRPGFYIYSYIDTVQGENNCPGSVLNWIFIQLRSELEPKIMQIVIYFNILLVQGNGIQMRIGFQSRFFGMAINCSSCWFCEEIFSGGRMKDEGLAGHKYRSHYTKHNCMGWGGDKGATQTHIKIEKHEWHNK